MRGVVGKSRDEHNVAEAILAHTEGHNIYTAHCVCVRARARACVAILTCLCHSICSRT